MQVQGVGREADPIAHRLDTAGWALFIIWIGLALLFDIGWGWGLVGVAAIILGEAVVRWFKGLRMHAFSIAMGLMFLLGGVWQLVPVRFPLAPLLIIGLGLALLLNTLRGHRAR